jgi:single-strand DNA-binding protein
MINRAVIVGRLTRDVEVRKTQSGLSVASFTVACDRNRRGQDGQSQADFISCVAWRQSADFLGQYAHKGAMVGVEGRIQTRSYQNNTGATVYVTEIVADNVQLLESRAQSQQRAQQQSNGYQDSFQQPSYSQPARQSSVNNNNDSGSDNGFGGAGVDLSADDDLPF